MKLLKVGGIHAKKLALPHQQRKHTFFYSYWQVAYILTTAVQSPVHRRCSQAQHTLFWGQNLPKYLRFD